MSDPLPRADGRSLAGRYYRDAVAPLLERRWPGLPHAAGRLGAGSDVLGLDDEMSQDHDWGLRLTLLVSAERRDGVHELLSEGLPDLFDGLPTRIVFTGQSEPALTVEVETASGFSRSRLGVAPRHPMTTLNWLTLTGQAVLEVVEGPVFHDSAGDLTDIRERLAWYPDDVWWYVVATDWARLSEELPAMGRAGHRGDDLGAGVIAGRLVDVAMHLGFLLARRWAPYAKWRGGVFSRLPGMEPVSHALLATLRAETWPERQTCLAAALDELMGLQRACGLPGRPSATVPFHDRPYIHVDPLVIEDLHRAISDESVRRLARGRGSIEQQTDNVSLLVDPALRRAAMGLD